MEARKKETSKTTKETIKCACGCGQVLTALDGKGRPHKFISGHNSRIHNPHTKKKIRQVCKICGKEYWKPPSLANRGKNTYCSNKCRSSDTKSWLGGDKNPNWKGGIIGVQNIRWSSEYNNWRKLVYQSDGYMCQICGQKGTRSNPLHAHHIAKFSEYENLRFIVANGVTLCKACHLQA